MSNRQQQPQILLTKMDSIRNNSQNISQTTTYSNILKQTKYPSKTQGIVLQKIENIEFEQYVLAMENITDINNIIDAYPTSFNRICIFLKTKELAEDITEKYTHIIVQGVPVPVRKLISTAKRVVITVPAYIPNEIILEALRMHRVKIVSDISYLKLSNPRLAHINSGRRQVYVIEGDTQIPDSLVLEYENEQCRIYLSADKCSKCNRYGHPSERCRYDPRYLIDEQLETTTTMILDKPSAANNNITSEINPGVTSEPEEMELTDNADTEDTDIEIAHNEAIDSPTSMLTPSPSTIQENQYPRLTQKPRSLTVIQPLDKTIKIDPKLQKQLTVLRKHILEQTEHPYPLRYARFEKFIAQAINSMDPLNIAKLYTSEITELIRMVTATKFYLTDTKTKGKFTRLVTRMEKQIKEVKDDSSDYSTIDTSFIYQNN